MIETFKCKLANIKSIFKFLSIKLFKKDIEVNLNKLNLLINKKKFSNHHPIFNQFKRLIKNKQKISKKYVEDFIGTVGLKKYVPIYFQKTSSKIPEADNEYFEWISILESVFLAKKNKFIFYECGAGYGRWGVRAYKACKLAGINNSLIHFIESEPYHIDYLKNHLRINEVPKKNYQIHTKAMSDSNENGYFYIGAPKEFGSTAPNFWHGQSLIKDYENTIKLTKEKYHNNKVYQFSSGWKAIKIKKTDSNLLFNEKEIDLVDFDIQGEEYKIILNSINKLNSNVKKLHISTHSADIEIKLKKLLKNNKWVNTYDFPTHKSSYTPFGKIKFVDGVQVWINSRLNRKLI